MAASIEDADGTSWPCDFLGQTSRTVSVMMAGRDGFTAVTGGNPRNGHARLAAGLSYPIDLPGLIQGADRTVVFNKR